MPITYKQAKDLDNSMVAAQNVKLGQIISYLSGSSTPYTATFIPGAASVSASHSMSSVGFATVAFSGSVSPTANDVTVTVGATGSNVTVQEWKLWSSGSRTAATSPFTKVTITVYGS